MEPTISFFSGFQPSDSFVPCRGGMAHRLISVLSISIGTFLGAIFGWMMYEGKWAAALTLGPVLDVFRSVPSDHPIGAVL